MNRIADGMRNVTDLDRFKRYSDRMLLIALMAWIAMSLSFGIRVAMLIHDAERLKEDTICATVTGPSIRRADVPRISTFVPEESYGRGRCEPGSSDTPGR